MKKLILTTLAFTLLVTAFAAPKRYKLLRSSTNWYNTTNWSPAGLPADGDTIFIPEKIQLTLANDMTLKNVYFDLYGSVILSGLNMKLVLQNLSTFNVHTSGWIDGDKASQQLMLGGTLFKGNDPVVIGPKIATSSSNGFVTYYEPSVLPVAFTNFTVTRSHSNFQVQWTAAESNSAGRYEIQRSNDGAAWTSIATVFMAGTGTSNYSYTDKNMASATVCYRIKQVDADGNCSYTMVRTLKNTATAMPVISAAQQKITIQFPQQVKGNVLIEVMGVNGFVTIKKTIADAAGSVQLSATGLKGIYIVHVSNGNGLNTAKEIIL